MQISYRIDKRYSFPTTRVEVHPTCVIADIMLPDGRSVTIANPRDWDHRLVQDDGKLIEVIKRA